MQIKSFFSRNLLWAEMEAWRPDQSAFGGVGLRGWGGVPLYYCFWRREDLFAADRGGFPLAGSSEINLDFEVLWWLQFYFWICPPPPPPPPHPSPKEKPCHGMFGAGRRGGPLVSGARCPLTVRLTGRLWELIDWLVPRPPRALAAALEVRGGHLLRRPASFCTVATPAGKQRQNPTKALSSSVHPHPSPPLFTLGKWGRRQLKPFSLFRFSSSLSSEVAL